MRSTGRVDAHRTWLPAAIVALGCGVLLVFLVRAALDHVPLYDELLHVLAAKGVLATGEPVIANGVYSRASLFTRIVAAAFGVLGESPRAARVPALLAGALLVAVLAWWSSRRLSWQAGAVAGAVLCLMPLTLQLAVFARFYTLHALVVLLIAIFAYASSESGRAGRQRVLLALPILPLLAFGWHLQETTAIAAASIALAVVMVVAWDRRSTLVPLMRRHPWRIALGAVLVVACGIGFVIASGLLASLRTAPVWASGTASTPYYYFLAFAAELPLFWPLSGLVIVAALYFRPRFALFCATVFVVSLAAHSIAAAKASRYVYYAMPFLAALWACVAAGAFERMQIPGWKRIAPLGLIAVFLLLGSVEGQRALRMAAGKPLTAAEMGYQGESDWSALAPLVEAGSYDRVIASNAMKALFYLGRYDLELNASIVAETDTAQEFGRDPRTGGRAISTPGSLREALAAPGRVFVVVEDKKRGVITGVPAETIDVLETRCAPLQTGAQMLLHAWSCTGGQPRE